MKILTREDLQVAQQAIARATTPRLSIVAPAGQVIVAGSIDEATVAYLDACGATIIDAGIVTVVVLPELAIVEVSKYWWSYSVSFYDEDGGEIGPGLVIDACADDARQTMVTLASAKAA